MAKDSMSHGTYTIHICAAEQEFGFTFGLMVAWSIHYESTTTRIASAFSLYLTTYSLVPCSLVPLCLIGCLTVVP